MKEVKRTRNMRRTRKENTHMHTRTHAHTHTRTHTHTHTHTPGVPWYVWNVIERENHLFALSQEIPQIAVGCVLHYQTDRPTCSGQEGEYKLSS